MWVYLCMHIYILYIYICTRVTINKADDFNYTTCRCDSICPTTLQCMLQDGGNNLLHSTAKIMHLKNYITYKKPKTNVISGQSFKRNKNIDCLFFIFTYSRRLLGHACLKKLKLWFLLSFVAKVASCWSLQQRLLPVILGVALSLLSSGKCKVFLSQQFEGIRALSLINAARYALFRRKSFHVLSWRSIFANNNMNQLWQTCSSVYIYMYSNN